jgi:hypothetical protein
LLLSLVAGILKVNSVDKSALQFHIVTLAVSEIVLAVWLVSGYRTRVAEITASLLFACFAIHGAYRIALDKTACHCFGDFQIHPMGSFLLSLCAAVTLAAARYSRGYVVLLRSCFATMAIFVFGQLLTQSLQPASSQEATWISSMMEELEPSAKSALHQGSWLLVAVDPECESCQHLMELVVRSRERDVTFEVMIVVLRYSPDFEDLQRSLGFFTTTVHFANPTCLPATAFIDKGNIRDVNCGEYSAEYVTRLDFSR